MVTHLTEADKDVVSGRVQCDKDDVSGRVQCDKDVVRGCVAVHAVIGWDVVLSAHKRRLHPALDHFIAIHASRR